MKLLVLFALIAIFVGGNESVVVDCEFDDTYGWGYTCKVNNDELITSIDDREITGIRGEHLSGKTVDDLIGFYAGSKKVNFFPRGLKKFFKNIKYIEIVDSDLQEITKDDLKEFQQQLEVLFLFGNQIQYIEDGTFSGFEKLDTLFLDSNPCTSEDDHAEDNLSNVLELIRKVEASCKDPNYIPATTTTTLKPTATTENPIITVKYENIKKFNFNLKVDGIKY